MSFFYQQNDIIFFIPQLTVFLKLKNVYICQLQWSAIHSKYKFCLSSKCQSMAVGAKRVFLQLNCCKNVVMAPQLYAVLRLFSRLLKLVERLSVNEREFNICLSVEFILDRGLQTRDLLLVWRIAWLNCFKSECFMSVESTSSIFYLQKESTKQTISFKSSTGWEPWSLMKRRSDPFHNTWLKNVLFHTHVSCKSSHIVAFGAIKSSRFACQCYYNIKRLIRLQLFFFICSLFLNIGIFLFPK